MAAQGKTKALKVLKGEEEESKCFKSKKKYKGPSFLDVPSKLLQGTQLEAGVLDLKIPGSAEVSHKHPNPRHPEDFLPEFMPILFPSESEPASTLVGGGGSLSSASVITSFSQLGQCRNSLKEKHALQRLIGKQKETLLLPLVKNRLQGKLTWH